MSEINSKQGRILICGTGSASHVMAALLGNQGNWQLNLLSLSQRGETLKRLMREGDICCQELSVSEAERLKRSGYVKVGGLPELPLFVGEADVILMAMPAFGHESYLSAIVSHLTQDTTLILMPAYGCADLLVQQQLKALPQAVPDNINLVLLEQLPWVCRTEQFGRLVNLLAHKQKVHCVAMSFNPQGNPITANSSAIAQTVSWLQSICRGHLVYNQQSDHRAALALSLFNPNAIMHSALMFGFYQCPDAMGYRREHFPARPLFYQQFSPGALEQMEALSQEVLAVKQMLLEKVPSLKESLVLVRSVYQWMNEAYQGYIQDSSTLASSLKSNLVTRSLLHPMIPDDKGGFKPDFHHRYLTEDIPYGILPLKGFAELVGTATPALDEILIWAQDILSTSWLQQGKLTEYAKSAPARTPQRFNINNLEELIS